MLPPWLYEPMVEACESGANRRLAGIRQRRGTEATESSIDRGGSGVAGRLAARTAVRGLRQANPGRCHALSQFGHERGSRELLGEGVCSRAGDTLEAGAFVHR